MRHWIVIRLQSQHVLDIITLQVHIQAHFCDPTSQLKSPTLHICHSAMATQGTISRHLSRSVELITISSFSHSIGSRRIQQQSAAAAKPPHCKLGRPNCVWKDLRTVRSLPMLQSVVNLPSTKVWRVQMGRKKQDWGSGEYCISDDLQTILR